MSDYINQPQPGATSADGAYSKDPQNPTNYFQDNNQFGVVNSPSATQSTDVVTSWLNFSSGDYLKGLALGAGVALVATNPTVQKAVVSSAVKVWAALQGGVEELKEQVQDAKAEISQED